MGYPKAYDVLRQQARKQTESPQPTQSIEFGEPDAHEPPKLTPTRRLPSVLSDKEAKRLERRRGVPEAQ